MMTELAERVTEQVTVLRRQMTDSLTVAPAKLLAGLLAELGTELMIELMNGLVADD